MSPFNRPSQRTRKVLEQAPRPTSSAAKRATQGFLQAQQSPNTGESGELDDSEVADTDEAKFEHDTLVVQAVVYQALEQLSSVYSLVLTAQDLRDAQAIMTTVSTARLVSAGVIPHWIPRLPIWLGELTSLPC